MTSNFNLQLVLPNLTYETELNKTLSMTVETSLHIFFLLISKTSCNWRRILKSMSQTVIWQTKSIPYVKFACLDCVYKSYLGGLWFKFKVSPEIWNTSHVWISINVKTCNVPKYFYYCFILFSPDYINNLVSS